MDKCPECGNENLRECVEEIIYKEYSARTGRLLKTNKSGETNSLYYRCKCGWYSELRK